jgi:hypothetical protein
MSSRLDQFESCQPHLRLPIGSEKGRENLIILLCHFGCVRGTVPNVANTYKRTVGLIVRFIFYLLPLLPPAAQGLVELDERSEFVASGLREL